MIGDVETIKRVIQDQGLTVFFCCNMQGEKIDYHEGTVDSVKERVDQWVLAIANGTTFVIECWSTDTNRKPGSRGGKDSEKTARCRWVVQGRNGAPVPVITGTREVSGAPYQDGDLRERLARMESALEFERQQRANLEEELADIEEEEEEEEAEDEEEGEVPASAIAGLSGDQIVDVVTRLIDRLGPPKIAPPVNGATTAAPMKGAPSDEEAELLALWRKMKADRPDMAADLETQLRTHYGANPTLSQA